MRSETGSMNTNTIKINCVVAKSSLLIDHIAGEVYIEQVVTKDQHDCKSGFGLYVRSHSFFVIDRFRSENNSESF